MANCAVLTEGYDNPRVDCVVVARPTRSRALYVQMVGRGTRTAAGKADCRVLDYGANILRHGPIDRIEVKPKGRGAGEAPTKCCPSCRAEMPMAARVCPECDHELPAPEQAPRKASPRASSAAIISDGAPKPAPRPEELEVATTEYRAHTSARSGMRMLVAEHYGPGLAVRPIATEYVCLEHDGFARVKAERWWATCAGTITPATADEAVARVAELRQATAIRVVQEGKYQRVLARAFEEMREPGQDSEPTTVAPTAPQYGPSDDDDLPF
jgi:DNA repair protein RadD